MRNICWCLFWVALAIPRGVALGRYLRTDNTGREGRNNPDDAVDPLREFIGDAVLRLPEDITASEDFGFQTFVMNITTFRCFDVAYGEIILDSFEEEQANYFQLEITEFVFKCSFDISFSYGRFDGEGSVYVTSEENYLKTSIATGPVQLSDEEDVVDSCEGTSIALDELIFEGDLPVRILTLSRGFIRRIAENQIEEVFCELMSQDIMGFILDEVEEVIANYTGQVPEERDDPLFLESEIKRSFIRNDTFYDLQNDELMKTALTNMNKVYAERTHDSNTTTEDGMDFGLNIILREKFLEDDGAFIFIDESDEEFESAETSLVDFNVTIHSVKIYGLDTATVLSPLEVIGSRTIKTSVLWERISIKVNATVETRASSDAFSFFDNGGELDPIIENIIVVAGADNISATISLLVPLDRELVDDLPVGYILNWRDLPACIPPVLFDIALSGLVVDLGNIHQPAIEGIASEDINKLVQKGSAIGLQTFESAILGAIPGLFQTDGRDITNINLKEYHCFDDGQLP